MRKIIINADDFGRTQEINNGIIEAFNNGVVRSCTLMTTGKYFYEAVGLAKKHSALHVGLHLDLSEYFNIKKGEGKVLGYKDQKVPLLDIEKTIKEQIVRFKETGLVFTHIDSHYHIHLREELFPLILNIADQNGVKSIRFISEFYLEKGHELYHRMNEHLKLRGIKRADAFVNGWDFEKLSLIDESLTIELMTHPACVSKEKDNWRYTELAHACSESTKKYFKDNHYRLINFQEL